jgi:hypothetical protein
MREDPARKAQPLVPPVFLAPWFDDKSRMMREYHVRFCERLGGKSPGRLDGAKAAPLFWTSAINCGERKKMNQVPSGKELARPFLPAKDFDLSKRFYEALGFQKLLDGDLAIFSIGSSGFILQRFYQKESAENYMMQLMVDDLGEWWKHIGSLDLPGQFGVGPPKAPAMQPWGLRVAYVVDPSGVLWHVAERRDGAVYD